MGSTAAVRRGLVGVQFFLSVSIMAGTLVAWQQTEFMRQSDLGFNDETLVIPYYWDSDVNSRLSLLKEEMGRLAPVKSVTASGDVPGRMFTSMSYWIEGMDEEETGGINALIVDPDFAETYGLHVVAGRDFSLEQSAALGESFILNEAAVRELGLSANEAIGKQFRMNTEGPVVGVVKDFHFEGLQSKIEPLVLTVWPDWFGYLSLAIDPSRVDAAVASVGDTWSKLLPDRPFEYFLLDEDFETQYRSEKRFSEVFGVLALLAILISCMGLLGLAAFTAEQKTKEIGIRKVFGASVTGIVALVNREFVTTMLVGGLVSLPISRLLMDAWLETFAYRTDVGIMPYVLSVVLIAFIGLVTVSYHAIRAAVVNPIESLRYE